MKKDTKIVQQQLETIKNLQDSLIEIHNSEPKYMENKSQQNLVKLQQLIQKKRQINSKFSQYLGNVLVNLKMYTVPYAIFLVAHDIINRINNYIFTQGLVKCDVNSQQSEMFKEAFTKIIKTINNIEPNFLSTFWVNYKTPQNKDVDNKQEQKINDYEQLRNILIIMIDTQKQFKKNNMIINYAYKSILEYEMKDKKNDEIYEQIALNWFKLKLNNMQSDKEYICCKTLFKDGQSFECPKKTFFDFKSFTKIQQNIKVQDEQQELSKTIAALMNQRGGVIFIGIQSENGKALTVVGFQLQEKNKKQFVKFVKNAVNDIYPKHKGFEQCSESSSQYYSSMHELNYYISIQFMNVVKKSTLQNCKDPQKPYQKRYICKIVVKIGHPRYLYYVLKNEGSKEERKRTQVHFYTREESSNFKETVEKRYDKIYQKLIEYERLKSEGKPVFRPLIHDGCRYEMSMKQDMLILDSEDDDD